MKKKPIVQVLLSILLIGVVAIGITLAIQVANDVTLKNSFAYLIVDTEIEEPDRGNEADKKPTVSNKGTTSVFVRAKTIVATQNGSSVPVTEDDITFKYNTSVSTEKGYWIKKDGWYYYSKALAPGETTTMLFDGVEVNIDLDKGALFDVIVSHESVAAGSYKDAQEAFGAAS